MTGNSISVLQQALLAPRGIALVGASDDPNKTSGRALSYLLRQGCAAPIFPINPSRQKIQGVTAFSTIADVPKPVDHAFVTVPTAATLEAVAACIAADVKLITVLASGFAEAGPEGIARQAELQRLVAGTGSRLIGPNGLGFVSAWTNTALTANAAFAVNALPRGRTTVLSQSGSLIGTLFSRGRARGIGFATLISVGNEADLSIGELGEALLSDEKTDCFVLFLETIRHARALQRFAKLAADVGKPILAYKLGRSDVGAELAVSHTGALVGIDAAADAFLRDCGIARVDVLESLIEAPLLFRSNPRGRSGATIVTTTGGGGALVADRLGVAGIEPKPISTSAREILAENGIHTGNSRIVDLSLAGARYDTIRKTIEALLADPNTNVVACVIGSSAELQPEESIRPIVDAVAAAGTGAPPVAVFVVPNADAALKMLAKNSIAAFRSPEACADSIAAFLRPRAYREQIAIAAPKPAETLMGTVSGNLNEQESLNLFAALGVPVPDSIRLDWAALPDEDVRLPRFPVVAKLLSKDLPHKAEAGAVTINIKSFDELAAAIRRMKDAALAYAPGAAIEGVLVQEQRPALAEALIGVRREPGVGVIVTLAAGGTLTEIYRDASVRLAPVSAIEAREMVDEVKGLAMIRGYRNLPLGDCDALAEAIAQVSALAAMPRVLEAEINPILIHEAGAGVTAVDGLVVLDTTEPRRA